MKARTAHAITASILGGFLLWFSLVIFVSPLFAVVMPIISLIVLLYAVVYTDLRNTQ